MSLTIPNYLSNYSVGDVQINYSWEEGVPKAVDEDLLKKKIELLSQRGRIVLANGIAEWIIYRFHSLLPKEESDFELNEQFSNIIEAAWAGVIDRWYVLPFNMEHRYEELTGPVLGVIRQALALVYEHIDLAWQNGETVHTTIKLIELARYVLPETEVFNKWLNTSMANLQKLTPKETKDWVGEIVPREALDPEKNFNPEDTEALIQKFLQNISLKDNPYVATTEDMRSWGFAGKPYEFNLQEDRKARVLRKK